MRLWLLGCGNMGGALLARWQAGNLAKIHVIDPQPLTLPPGVGRSALAPDGEGPDVLVLAVKPQMFAAAAAGLVGRLRTDTLVISVMAGSRCTAISDVLYGLPVVRTMPNTPARLGVGVTALFSLNACVADCARADGLMAAAGATVWLDNEAQFDAVTGLSGSGPAYVFAFIEALGAAGVAAGLSPALAARLAQATVTGAARLAAEPGADPAALRVAVTSPGGTTAAGLSVLTAENGLESLLRATVAAAQARSQELAG